ncbi:hypothetical protein [uncultured Gammaproteobacteria bacterium]|nr:hypothetical protein BROOK1789B_648 [Bathymodiolus brooksi thiotrophic gill symbiont]CAC9617051.1 hypothetical protein [uncultured Gammaproteobacteria bacterium]CAC9966339.1 hypothetical protein [uncultured Gammaproteobacteria bacterium]
MFYDVFVSGLAIFILFLKIVLTMSVNTSTICNKDRQLFLLFLAVF